MNLLLRGLGPAVFLKDDLALEFRMDSINSSTGVDSRRVGWIDRFDA